MLMEEIELMDEGLALEPISKDSTGPVYNKRLKVRIENCKALENIAKYDIVIFVSKNKEVKKHPFSTI